MTEHVKRTKRRVKLLLPASLLNARLRELFWHAPDLEHVAEFERRIAQVLDAGEPPERETPKALMPEPIQVFDDLYDLAAC